MPELFNFTYTEALGGTVTYENQEGKDNLQDTFCAHKMGIYDTFPIATETV
jgi:hypothetical protein